MKLCKNLSELCECGNYLSIRGIRQTTFYLQSVTASKEARKSPTMWHLPITTGEGPDASPMGPD